MYPLSARALTIIKSTARSPRAERRRAASDSTTEYLGLHKPTLKVYSSGSFVLSAIQCF